MKAKLADLISIWENEKKKVADVNSIKEKIDDLNTRADRAQREGDYQTTAKIRYNDIPEAEKELKVMEEKLADNRFVKLEVDTEDIADIVSKWTGIPVQKMLSGEKEKLLTLEDALHRRVKGQDEAIRFVADVIRMSKMGVTDQDRPTGSFLFMGNTGVGKTELAKTLAETLFDDERALVRLDMSEFSERHSVAKLIGSPPGYVGYDEGGQLTERIRRRPYAVILFDEIEKAHPTVLNVLLQILDDGRLTDTKGRTVNFKNTIIIMTSNLTSEELRRSMRPEFINRIDEIITFQNLDRDVIRQIVDLRLQEVQDKLKEQSVELGFSSAVKSYLVDHGYDPQFGARPIQRIIKREILSGLSKYLLLHPDVNQVAVGQKEGEIIFNAETPAQA